MRAKVYTMASAKGGSGKTLLTATFAAFLSELGKKVLIIDSDSTTNGLTLMYLKEVLIEKELILSKNISPIGVFDFHEDDISNISIVKLGNEVSLIPATFAFDNLKNNFRGIYGDFFIDRLQIILKDFKSQFDYIFIDAQAGSDYFAEIAINKNISDEVIIVSEYDPLSAAGVERLKGIFREDLTYNRTWYLLNKMIPEFIQSFSDFLEIAKYLNPIPWDADVVRAYARRRLPLDLDNGNEFTIAIIQTLKTLLGEEMSIEIDDWKMKKESMFKEPIDVQYDYLKQRLERIEHQDRKKKYKTFIYSISLSISLITIMYILNNYLDGSSNTYIKIALGVVTAAGLIIITKMFSLKDDFKNIERDVIYDKLKKLESLKYSNFDALVRDRQNSHYKW